MEHSHLIRHWDLILPSLPLKCHPSAFLHHSMKPLKKLLKCHLIGHTLLHAFMKWTHYFVAAERRWRWSRLSLTPTQIWRILNKIGWPTTTPEFDEPQDLNEWDICQLLPDTADGFMEEFDLSHDSDDSGPDPPGYEDNIDPPHWEEAFIQYD